LKQSLHEARLSTGIGFLSIQLTDMATNIIVTNLIH